MSVSVSRVGAAVPVNAAWAFAGNAVYALSQWSVLVILARLAAPETVGRYAVGLAVCAPVLLLANLSLRTVQVTDARGEHRFADHLTLRLLTCAGALAVIAVTGAVIGGETGLVVLLVGIAKAVDALADVCFGLFQRHERLVHVAVSLIVNGLGTVTLTGGIYAVTGSLPWAVTGSIGASVLAVLCCLVPARALLARDITARAVAAARRESVVSLARIALPLGIASALTSLSANLPLYAVHELLGTREAGIFAALAYVGLAATTVISAVGQAVLPGLSRLYANGDRAGLLWLLGRLVGGAAVAGALAVGAVVALGRPALALVYGAPYMEHATLLAWLVAATGIGAVAWFLDAAVSAARRFGDQLRTGFLVLAVVAAAALLLVPRFGLAGAAWTAVLASVAQVLFKGLVLARTMRGTGWS
jgi:O-antigen/teichoic acid export membrane protein